MLHDVNTILWLTQFPRFYLQIGIFDIHKLKNSDEFVFSHTALAHIAPKKINKSEIISAVESPLRTVQKLKQMEFVLESSRFFVMLNVPAPTFPTIVTHRADKRNSTVVLYGKSHENFKYSD